MRLLTPGLPEGQVNGLVLFASFPYLSLRCAFRYFFFFTDMPVFFSDSEDLRFRFLSGLCPNLHLQTFARTHRPFFY